MRLIRRNSSGIFNEPLPFWRCTYQIYRHIPCSMQLLSQCWWGWFEEIHRNIQRTITFSGAAQIGLFLLLSQYFTLSSSIFSLFNGLCPVSRLLQTQRVENGYTALKTYWSSNSLFGIFFKFSSYVLLRLEYSLCSIYMEAEMLCSFSMEESRWVITDTTTLFVTKEKCRCYACIHVSQF
jgi:hypothetical protein